MVTFKEGIFVKAAPARLAIFDMSDSWHETPVCDKYTSSGLDMFVLSTQIIHGISLEPLALL